MSLNIARSTGPLIICPGSLSAQTPQKSSTPSNNSNKKGTEQTPSKQAKDVAPFMGFMPDNNHNETAQPALSLKEFLDQNHAQQQQQQQQTEEHHDDLSSIQVEDIDDGSVISFLKTEEAKDILLRLAHQPTKTNNIIQGEDAVLPPLETSLESDDGSGDEAITLEKHHDRSLLFVEADDDVKDGVNRVVIRTSMPVAAFVGIHGAIHMVGAFVAHESHSLFPMEMATALSFVLSGFCASFSNASTIVVALYGLVRLVTLSLAAPRDANALWTLLQTGDMSAFVVHEQEQSGRMRTRHHQPNYLHSAHEPWRNIAFYEGGVLVWATFFLLPHLLGMTTAASTTNHSSRQQRDPNQMAAVYGGTVCCVVGLLAQLCANAAVMEWLSLSGLGDHSMMSGDQQLMLDLGELGFWYGLWMMNVLGKPMAGWKQVMSMGALAAAMVCTHQLRQGSLLDSTKHPCPHDMTIWESSARASFLQYDTTGDHDRISALHHCISATSPSPSGRLLFGRNK